MANTAQAEKRVRQAEKRRQQNVSMRSMFRTSIKKVLKAIEAAKKEDAQSAYQAAVSIIDSMVSRGLIHRNKAARHKSRLNTRIKGLIA